MREKQVTLVGFGINFFNASYLPPICCLLCFSVAKCLVSFPLPFPPPNSKTPSPSYK
ncbi:hypothetical protein Hanom_Chr16g01445161 [Helianthus anomalus]